MKLKHFTLEELIQAKDHLAVLCTNPVADMLTDLLVVEIKQRRAPKFVKMNDKELDNLKVDDVYTRAMEPTDEHYINGYYGLFLKSNNKLLRRHSDL